MKQFDSRMEISSVEAFNQNKKALETLLEDSSLSAKILPLAKEYKEIMEQLDPLIQKLSSESCPSCGVVCCAQKFGIPNTTDLLIALALNIEDLHYDFAKDLNGMCQFMGKTGCILPRYKRPFRCTFYFCDPLLIQIDLLPPKEHRSLIDGLQKLEYLRYKMAILAGIKSPF